LFLNINTLIYNNTLMVSNEVHLYVVLATNLLILRSQKSQEISIRRSSNEVRTLRDRESNHAEFSFMRQHSLQQLQLMKTINDKPLSVRDEKILVE